MTLTLSIPTWDAIKNFVAVIILYYGTWVAPQFDWYIIGVAYLLGALTLGRAVYRRDSGIEIPLYVLCMFWPLFAIGAPLVKFIVFYVTFANPKKNVAQKEQQASDSNEWKGRVKAKANSSMTITCILDDGTLVDSKLYSYGMYASYNLDDKVFGTFSRNSIGDKNYTIKGLQK